MASLNEFELILKEVVNTKRLSASKMTRLTEIALKSMEYDTQLVSILYRTHKSLPPAAKVSSLYVFDALSRAARHQANKQGITGNLNTPTGNAATFLLKIEGVLEGLFQDMITVGSSEAKEKTQKILDIWVKGTTFPPKILSQLTNVVKGAEKVPEIKPLTTSDPRTAVAPQPVVSTPNPPAATAAAAAAAVVTPAMDPQAMLLALLAQAANAAAIPTQTTANTSVAPVFDAQLAVLQQLALAQTTSSAAPSQPAQPQAPPAQSGSASPTPSSYRKEPFDTHHKDRRYNGPQSSDRVNAYDDQPEERASFRGGFRGGFRGRGRGRDRWDDRDRDRYRERDSRDVPSYRVRRSRSRSPPNRLGSRHDVRPYSPPRRRPNFSPTGGRNSADPGATASDTPGKDEFGRDIRPSSPESDTTIIPLPKHAASASPPPPASSVSTAASGDQNPSEPPPAALTSNHDQMSLSPLITTNTSSSPGAPVVSNIVSAQEPGLDTFNIATFDFTSPQSWEALGKMWSVTHGYMPTTEELGQFVMMGGQAAFASAPAPTPVQQRHGWEGQGQAWRGRGRGGFMRGRGGFGYGNTRGAPEDWGQQDNHGTDAIVLGGGSDTGMEVEQTDTSQMRGSGGGGRMQRVGDKWVFVRDPVAT